MISADLDFYKHAYLPSLLPHSTYFILWHPVACMQPVQGGGDVKSSANPISYLLLLLLLLYPC